MRTLIVLMLMMLLDGIVFQVRGAAQSRCDPQTQYEEAGQCCKKCGPGRRMLSPSTCLDPQCVDCGEHEFQQGHTTSALCERQPYCDPNKNLQVSAPESKRRRSSCVCTSGFHCSGETCATCLPHAICPPGEFTTSPGNHTHDTVCGKCPDGSFSSSGSGSGVCTKWTECGRGHHLKASGTHVSDNICEKSTRMHYILILSLAAVCAVACVMAFLCREKARQRTKECWEMCHTDPEKPAAEPTQSLFTSVEDPDPVLLIKQEEGETRAPEENQEEPRDKSLPTAIRSENGQVVLQERWKDEAQETENTFTQPFVNSV